MKVVNKTFLPDEPQQLSELSSAENKSKTFSPKLIHSDPQSFVSLKPFVKWAGGKRQLIQTLITNLPNQYGRYFEPFIGGGALLLTIQAKNAVISDVNTELINAYLVIRDDVEALIDSLKQHTNESDYFYKIRGQTVSELNAVERASRFIFLNKTCFNGLYRENSKGQFNTPFGKYKNPNIADQDNLRLLSKYLLTSNIRILNSGFQDTIKLAKKGDFIYFDPPYYPISATASFTKYAKGDFTPDNQRELAKTFKALDKKGCYVMLSNSNTDFIKDLYKDYKVVEIEATRFINCKANKRGKGFFEILVKNY